VSLYENRHHISCKAFIGLPIRAKMVGWGRPLKGKFSSQSETPVSARADVSDADKQRNHAYLICITTITMQYKIYNNAN